MSINLNQFITLFLGIIILSASNGCSKTSAADRAQMNRYLQALDSAPHSTHIPNISKIENAIPKYEPKSRYGNPKSYKIRNKKYTVLPTSFNYKQKGLASWYGTKFHGQRTSSGEAYDMFGMTAAHCTLPVPSYVEVTNLDNHKKVIVKINDRGPFHDNRLIDLSYSAAAKLGILQSGTGRVEVKSIDPRDHNTLTLATEALKK